MKSGLSIVIMREYLERVKRKSFIISTLVVPLLMIAMMFAPALIMLFSESESKTVAVIDETGILAARLKSNDEIKFVFTGDESIDEARTNDGYDAILVLGSKAIEKPQDAVILYSHGSLTMVSDSYISGQVCDAIEDVRLKAYNIENLEKILREVKVDITMPIIDIDKEEDTATSSVLSYILALVMDMMLYMFILIYGQMVMTSIIEEKTNRVLELVVSSVKPQWLMLGKIIGVGLVAITQILIWTGILGLCSSFALPMMAAMPEAATEPEFAGIIAQLSDVGFIISLAVYMLLFFIGGYLFYSAIFAAIGSAVDNIQDASQLTSIATMPVIIGIIASMSVINNPTSDMAFWLSVIPFTSPMTMMSRLPFGVPAWEIIVSLVVLYISFMLLIWVCAKIYRVGIFMYGKKPTLVEIIRWARYK
ncbi:MAG: ABC transporter permease [Muribaculaceae bacterium]|nr:ABC transporter permease [Muribaculaceae bacterium]